MPAGKGAVGIPVDLGIVMRVQVDRPRRNHAARSVKLLLSLRLEVAANFGNLAVENSKIGPIRRQPSPINDSAITNDEVILSHTTLLI